MNKYLSQPESIIDLHGMTKLQTLEILDNLMIGSNNHVRIITGKGNKSANTAILKDFVKNYLNEMNVKYNQSKIADGGEGALEVFFKR